MPTDTLRARIKFRLASTHMENGFGAALATLPPPKKSAARVAMVGIHGAAETVLTDCFRQFGIESLLLTEHEAIEKLAREKFEACVVKLSDIAQPVMESARKSKSNSRMILYGLGGSAQEAMRYSKFCINAVFHEPIERQAALKLVRATQMLVLHEFRRYVRIPVMTEVGIIAQDGKELVGTSQEISSGGMSLKCGHPLEPGQQVEVSFALLTLPRVWVRGNVAWRGKNRSYGIRFDINDARRQSLKEWIEAYLES